MKRWLIGMDEFAWRILLSVWLLVGGASIIFAVIVVTVLLKSRKESGHVPPKC